MGFSFPAGQRDGKAQPPELTDQQLEQHGHGEEPAIDFLNIVESHNLIQHVNEPTHSGGHTLDLELSLGLDVSSIHCEDMLISDHKCFFFNIISIADPHVRKNYCVLALLPSLPLSN